MNKINDKLDYLNNKYKLNLISLELGRMPERQDIPLGRMPERQDIPLGRMPERQDIPLELGRMPERQDIANKQLNSIISNNIIEILDKIMHINSKLNMVLLSNNPSPCNRDCEGCRVLCSS